MDIFKKITEREIPADIIFEDDRVIAIKDINPVNPGHFLVIPKVHSINLIDINEEDMNYLFSKARELANKTIKEMNVSGFKLQVNNGKESGQEVFRTHIHIIPSKK